jgi:hypothetical protein
MTQRPKSVWISANHLVADVDPAPENWTVYKCEFSRTRVVTEADIAEVTC